MNADKFKSNEAFKRFWFCRPVIGERALELLFKRLPYVLSGRDGFALIGVHPRSSAAKLVFVFLIAFAMPALAQDAKLVPVDEGATNAAWPKFKAQLLEALANRDQKFVLGIVDRRIRNISPNDGVAEFRKLWEPESPASPLWVELPKVLHLGSAFVKREKGLTELCAPYVHYKWPDSAPASANAAVIAKEALVKDQPSAGAKTLQTLSYNLVRVLDWEVADVDKSSKQEWVKLQTSAGTGFVPEEQVRSPLEYRACFVRSGAGWRMTALEVGE